MTDTASKVVADVIAAYETMDATASCSTVRALQAACKVLVASRVLEPGETVSAMLQRVGDVTKDRAEAIAWWIYKASELPPGERSGS